MTDLPTDDQSRMQRRRRSHVMRRAALIAGLAILTAAILGGGYYVWLMRQVEASTPPTRLVVIAETELEDGTKVAGAVAVVEAGEVHPVDTLASARIPGTSYDRLRDALSLGGSDLVAKLAAGSDEGTGWLLLDEKAWAQLVDETGGVRVSLAGGTTVFTGEKLFRFSKGQQTLTGDQAVALLRGSETLSGKGSGAAARQELTRAIGKAVLGDADTVTGMLAKGRAESSEKPIALSEFIKAADK